MPDPARLSLKQLEHKIAPLEKKGAHAWWNAYTTGKPQFYKKAEKTKIQWRKFFNNPTGLQNARQNEANAKNALDKRQWAIVRLRYEANQGSPKTLHAISKLETKVEKKFNTFRARINKKKLTDNDLKAILKKETNSKKLEVAWNAGKKQGALVADDVIELARLRNRLAQSAGHDNYYDWCLETSEQSRKDVNRVFKNTLEKSDRTYTRLKKQIDDYLAKRLDVVPNDLAPWHYQDPFFQRAPDCFEVDLDKYYSGNLVQPARQFYAGLGLPVDAILKKSDLFERAGKSQHAFALDLDKKGDARVLLNIRPNAHWMGTTLHELGHAVYWKHMDPKLPYFVRETAHTLVTEAMALFFENFAHNEAFLKKFGTQKIGANDLEKSRTALAADELVFSRWSAVMLDFEQRLYDDPESDLNGHWWKLVQKHQGIRFSRDEPDWASKLHVGLAPVYYHNYLHGKLLAEQWNAFICRRVIREKDPSNADYNMKKKAGQWLKHEIFDAGMKHPWNELVKRATGNVLSPDDWIRRFAK